MLRGNTVMKGYLKNAEATAAAFDGGWFHSGDLGVLHPDGYIEVKDRSKDIIISGGENISSLEVEETLYRHPGILEAAVVARPDRKWGETPCAFVTPRDGESLTAEEVIAFCQLTSFEALEVYEHSEDGDRGEVAFFATLSRGGKDTSFGERSTFYRVDGRWLYHSGEPIGRG